jgi:predicted kinase
LDLLEKIKTYKSPAYDWKERLESTTQEKEYHAEGNVWIHTILVVESLLEDADYTALDWDKQKILLLAAVLHDIAKPFCTRIEDGIITSPNHSVKGEIEARKLIYKYGFMNEIIGKLSFAEREQVCSLVRYHGLPLLFMEKFDMQRAVFKASLEINLEYLYMIAKADVKGRYSKYNESSLETIELFKEYCVENGCFTEPRHFQNPSGKLLYFKRGAGYLDYAPHESDKVHVHMMSGIPASGKDTYIKNNFSSLAMVSLDEIRKEMGISPTKNQGEVVQEAKSRAKKLMAKKESFVYNATNTTHRMRTPIIDLLLDYDANIEVIYTETPIEELLKRNATRERYVPENVIHKLIDNLEVPKLWESQIVRYTE